MQTRFALVLGLALGIAACHTRHAKVDNGQSCFPAESELRFLHAAWDAYLAAFTNEPLPQHAWRKEAVRYHLILQEGGFSSGNTPVYSGSFSSTNVFFYAVNTSAARVRVCVEVARAAEMIDAEFFRTFRRPTWLSGYRTQMDRLSHYITQMGWREGVSWTGTNWTTNIKVVASSQLSRLSNGMTLAECRSILGKPGTVCADSTLMDTVCDFDFDGLEVLTFLRIEKARPVVEEFLIVRDQVTVDARAQRQLCSQTLGAWYGKEKTCIIEQETPSFVQFEGVSTNEHIWSAVVTQSMVTVTSVLGDHPSVPVFVMIDDGTTSFWQGTGITFKASLTRLIFGGSGVDRLRASEFTDRRERTPAAHHAEGVAGAK